MTLRAVIGNGSSSGDAAPRANLSGLLAPFVGFDLPGWRSLLRENQFAVDPVYYPKAAISALFSLANSSVGQQEQRRYGREIAKAQVEPPIFVLGHARSGTSHLHRLLATDERFAYPNTYQIWRPHVFLSTEERRAKMIARFLPKTRPMDNMAISLDAPAEDEYAMMFLTRLSPSVGSIFPRHRERYWKYLDFRQASADERARWKSAFHWFLQKLTYKYRCPLVLKSPQHTARLGLLLEVFPNARFVHIHRDPYTIYQSTHRLFTSLAQAPELQRAEVPATEERIFRQYSIISDAFFADKALIPPGQFHELRFENLERDPIGQLDDVYQALGLGGFERVEPELRRYVGSLGGYRKNAHREPEPALKQRIVRAWQRNFDEWGYAT